MLPKRFEHIVRNSQSGVIRFLVQHIVLFSIIPTRTYGLKSSCNISFLFRFTTFIIPVAIPKRKNIIVPDFFNHLIINSAPFFLFQLLPTNFSSLNQYRS